MLQTLQLFNRALYLSDHYITAQAMSDFASLAHCKTPVKYNHDA